MNIALIAEDSKKELMAQVCIAYCGTSLHSLCAGLRANVSEAPAYVRGFQRSQGGEDQIAARIGYNEIDVLLMFRDPDMTKPIDPNEANLLRLCDVYNVPVATNIATAEAIIHSLSRGDLDWREIVNPKR